MATRTMHVLFGAGLYGRNGFNPMVSTKIWTTYIRPRLLHGAELWCLCVTLAMMGMFPIEAEIDRKSLTFFRNIIKDKNSLEFDICERQLAVKGSKSRSWLIYITALLTKYNLPAPEHMLYSTPIKGAWKTLLLSRIREHWNTHMYREASVKSSLRFLSEDTLNVSPAFVWRSTLHSHRYTEKAFVSDPATWAFTH